LLYKTRKEELDLYLEKVYRLTSSFIQRIGKGKNDNKEGLPTSCSVLFIE
jgi:hypothetical protein